MAAQTKIVLTDGTALVVSEPIEKVGPQLDVAAEGFLKFTRVGDKEVRISVRHIAYFEPE